MTERIHNTLPIGSVVGDYKILLELGRGGMGVVYKAHDTTLDRNVALKILPRHLSGNADFAERFKREAKATAGLSHPNVVTIYAIGEHEGHQFIAMQYVTGQNLATLIRQSGHLEPKQAMKITLQVADALAAAHRLDIVHRDINPQNIMVEESGRALVMDFGLAKVLNDEIEVTKRGVLLGTPRYMSPEQCEGKETDRRTDIYSLGVVLYEMLTGRVPFEASTHVALMRDIVEKPFPDPTTSSIHPPQEILQILNKMVAKRPEDRYVSAEALAADIHAFHLHDSGQHTPSPQPTALMQTPVSQLPSSPSSPGRKSRRAAIALGFGIAAMLLFIGAYWFYEVNYGSATEPRQLTADARTLGPESPVVDENDAATETAAAPDGTGDEAATPPQDPLPEQIALQAAEKAVAVAEAEVARIETELGAAREMLATHTVAVEEAEKLLERLQGDVKDAQDDIAKTQGELTEAQTHLAEAKSARADAEKILDAARNIRMEAELKTARLKAEAALTTAEAEAEAMIESTQRESEAAELAAKSETDAGRVRNLDGKWTWVDNDEHAEFVIDQAENGAVSTSLFTENVHQESLIYSDGALTGLIVIGEEQDAMVNHHFAMTIGKEGLTLSGVLTRWTGDSERTDTNVTWRRIDIDPDDSENGAS